MLDSEFIISHINDNLKEFIAQLIGADIRPKRSRNSSVADLQTSLQNFTEILESTKQLTTNQLTMDRFISVQSKEIEMHEKDPGTDVEIRPTIEDDQDPGTDEEIRPQKIQRYYGSFDEEKEVECDYAGDGEESLYDFDKPPYLKMDTN